MTFKIPAVGPTCIRCGHDKKLHALREPALGMADDTDSEFFVCRNRDKCLARQLAARPARMRTQRRQFCVLPDCYCDGMTQHP